MSDGPDRTEPLDGTETSDVAGALDVTGGWDTDGDGLADTVVTDDGVDLLVHTDLDGDGVADQVLRIGPDGTVTVVGAALPGPDD